MRLALGIEYDGGEFSGWQRLDRPGEPSRRSEATLQSALERALSFVAGHRVDTTCAGRTDAGVHAACQVVHFDTERSEEHTSELQSLMRISYAVFCLKQKTKTKTTIH